MTRHDETLAVPARGTVTVLLAQALLSGPGGSGRETSLRALNRYEEIFDAAVRAHAGIPSDADTEGRKAAVFTRGADALVAALDAQTALGSERWPTGEPLGVRMAIDTGDADVDDRGMYAGHPFTHARQLCDAAHGGQILTSGATAEVAGSGLPRGASLVDLGVRWLRDVQRRQRVYQLTSPGLQQSFPPLGSLEVVPNNLPVAGTSFIGREAERSQVGQLLVDQRAVTLTGGGGCGKTRLAAEVAAEIAGRFPAGVWWVDLSALENDEEIPGAAMSALGIGDTRGLTPIERLVGHLSGPAIMLVLDNCEHVRDGSAELADSLLAECAALTVLATSREPVGISGESVWQVPPLSHPGRRADQSVETLTAYDAVQLFADRAIDARPNFRVTTENAPAVAQICARLDGIPLAIELAAARTRMMSVERILEALDDRFRLLTGGIDQPLKRQQTLLASVEWSYDLLADSARTLLRRLGVFAGGFALDAAEAACAGDGVESIEILDLIGQLVDRSLVQFDELHDDRYRMLETIRDFAAARLEESAEADVVRDRHLGFCVQLAEEIVPAMERTPASALLDRFEAERDNFRVAMEWGLGQTDATAALRLATALGPFWVVHGHYWEAQRWLRRALDIARNASPGLRARGLSALAHASLMGMDVAGLFGYPVAQEALDLARESGDDATVVRALADLAFVELGMMPEAAQERLEEALTIARRTGDAIGLALALLCRAFPLAFFQDRHDDALPFLDEIRAIGDGMGNRYLIATSQALTGCSAIRRGRLSEGRALIEGALDVARDMSEPVLEMLSATALADVMVTQGHLDAANELAAESADRLRRSARGRVESLELQLARAQLTAGDMKAASETCDRVLPAIQELAIPYFAALRNLLLARIRLFEGSAKEAQTVLEEGLAYAQALDNPWLTAQALHLLGHVGRTLESPHDAEDRHHQALVIQMSYGFVVDAVDALEAISGLAIVGESWAEGVRLGAAMSVVRNAIGASRPANDETRQAEDFERARTALGEETFAKAWTEGTLLTLEQAVAYATRARGERRRPSSGWASLTPTEEEVVRLAAQGLTNPDIAEQLFISRATVKTHLAHVFTKLGVSTRAELAAEATRRHI